MTDPEQTPALKACPFCKAVAKFGYDMGGGVYVGCGVRGCCGEGGDAGYLCFKSEAEAADAWNRRAPSEAPPSVSEREKVMRLARQHGESAKDQRGRESFEFDDHGLAAFADALLATYTIQRKP